MSPNTTTDPQTLVGRWIRLDRDEGRPPHLGLLTRAAPVPHHPGLYQWELRTPTGHMVGGPNLPAQPLTREHTDDVARARRQLTRALRRDRALLTELVAHGEPVGAVARAVTGLEHLQNTLADQLNREMSTGPHTAPPSRAS
ncbi:hypothetical protein ACWFMI_27395 [Nocardiopsis terrae]